MSLKGYEIFFEKQTNTLKSMGVSTLFVYFWSDFTKLKRKKHFFLYSGLYRFIIEKTVQKKIDILLLLPSLFN
jgi:hypothetical protein